METVLNLSVFQVRPAFLHRNKLPTRFGHKIDYLGIGLIYLNPKSHEILAIGSARTASGVNAVTLLPFKTVYKQLKIGHFMVFSHPKVQIWVFLTPGPMEATYPVPKIPLTKMGGQRGQNAPQITPRFLF